MKFCRRLLCVQKPNLVWICHKDTPKTVYPDTKLHPYSEKWDEIAIGPDERSKTLDEWRGEDFKKKERQWGRKKNQ